MGVPLMDDNVFAWFWIAIIGTGLVAGIVIAVLSL